MNDANNWIEEAARRKENEAKELEGDSEKGKGKGKGKEKSEEGIKVLEKVQAVEKLGAKGKIK